jgi:hypothetical protein
VGVQYIPVEFKCVWDKVLVLHTCNASYSGSRDQEDFGSRPTRANSSQDPISKKPLTTTIKG